MRRIAQLLAFIVVGLAVAWALSVNAAELPNSAGYRSGAYLLLAIGLYGATYGIDLRQARHDRKLITSAVTIGVIAKAILIGGSLALAWQDPLFLILGVAVAQIDPLSVAALMREERMSRRARTVLAAWSSFDDPFTVILAIYAAALAAGTFGLGVADGGTGTGGAALLYLANLAANLAMAALAWVLWRLIGGRTWLQFVLLAASIAVAVATGWMLAIALIGLFARPAAIDPWIGRITLWAMYTAAVLLGVLLIDGVRLVAGISLGVAAYVAQFVVAWPLTRGMPGRDRWHLAAAQQNGITAIILALTLEIQFDGVVAVVAPAIITANLLHVAVNLVLDRRLDRVRSGATAPPDQPAPRVHPRRRSASPHGPAD